MRKQNITQLENLSLFCHFAGMIIIFLGVLIGFMNFINGEIKHIQGGIFVFISGYAFVKISQKISSIVQDERNAPDGYDY